MKQLIVFALLLIAAFAMSDACKYVDKETNLLDLEKVKECFNTVTVPKAFTDGIIETLTVIGDFYPYVEISMHPPSDYFPTVNYSAGIETLTKLFEGKNEIPLKDVVRPVQKFIKSFHDGHFSLTLDKSNEIENPFHSVACAFPFNWDLTNVTKDKADVFLTPSEATTSFLGEDTVNLIKTNKDVAVKTVDGKPAFDFFVNFFGEYNDMKSQQGRLQDTRYKSTHAFRILGMPLEDDVLFGNHTVEYADGKSFTFHILYVNRANVKSRSDDFDMHPISTYTLEQEMEMLRFLKNYKPKAIKGRDLRENKFIPCGYIDGMNYITIDTFSPSDNEAFADEFFACLAEIDKNTDPITILFPMNGGGSLVLEQLMEYALTPDYDFRMYAAVRKGPKELAKKIFVDTAEYIQALADIDNNCGGFSTLEDRKRMWNATQQDTFGDIIHKRTKKYFVTQKKAYAEYANKSLTNVRKPTDIILATDGYCFSACSIFVLNSIRKGSAIVTGFGTTKPGDNQFVAAQCPSSVINPNTYFDTKEVCEKYGLSFQATLFESYNISAEAKETTPGDFEIFRIDKHLGYNKGVEPDIKEMIPYLKSLREEFKTKCNPLNKRLFLVDDACKSKVNDPNALAVGYACGGNGEWDKNTCKISSCKIGYAVDFDNNKCVENICDLRPEPSPSPSSSVHPSSASVVYPTILSLLALLAFFFFLNSFNTKKVF